MLFKFLILNFQLSIYKYISIKFWVYLPFAEFSTLTHKDLIVHDLKIFVDYYTYFLVYLLNSKV